MVQLLLAALLVLSAVLYLGYDDMDNNMRTVLYTLIALVSLGLVYIAYQFFFVGFGR